MTLIIQFIADFLDNQQAAMWRMHEILTGKVMDTGLLDKDGNDIFAGAFIYLARAMNGGETRSLNPNLGSKVGMGCLVDRG